MTIDRFAYLVATLWIVCSAVNVGATTPAQALICEPEFHLLRPGDTRLSWGDQIAAPWRYFSYQRKANARGDNDIVYVNLATSVAHIRENSTVVDEVSQIVGALDIADVQAVFISPVTSAGGCYRAQVELKLTPVE